MIRTYWEIVQPFKAEQEIINLSRTKWQWMADKNVNKLAPLFHDKSEFVHTSGTWKKDEELDIIKTGRIWKVLEGFAIQGGIERDGVYFVIKDEKAKEAETKVKSWLQKIKVVKEIKAQQ